MKRLVCLVVFFAVCIASKVDAGVVYDFSFDSSPDDYQGSGIGSVSVQGTPTITPGGVSGAYARFDGGNSSSSDAINLNVVDDHLSFGNFAIRLSVLNFPAFYKWDDYLGLRTSSGLRAHLERTGDDAISLFSDSGPGSVHIPPGDPLLVEQWYDLLLTGEAIGGDVLLSLYVDGQLQGTGTGVGRAGDSVTEIRIGGRVGADNRYINAGIDNVQVFDTHAVPEPSSCLALIGLTVGATLVRRRRNK